MREEYVIEAYSKTLNQSLREINLEMNNPAIQNKAYAQQWADAFAGKLNKKRHMQATDWVGRVRWEQAGLQTLPNYLFHTGS